MGSRKTLSGTGVGSGVGVGVGVGVGSGVTVGVARGTGVGDGSGGGVTIARFSGAGSLGTVRVGVGVGRSTPAVEHAVETSESASRNSMTGGEQPRPVAVHCAIVSPRHFRRPVTNPSVPNVGCTGVQRYRSHGVLPRAGGGALQGHPVETSGAQILCLHRQRACVFAASLLSTAPDR